MIRFVLKYPPCGNYIEDIPTVLLLLLRIVTFENILYTQSNVINRERNQFHNCKIVLLTIMIQIYFLLQSIIIIKNIYTANYIYIIKPKSVKN